MLTFQKPYFLGVDFGTSSIKIVELTLKNSLPELVNYGYVEMSSVEEKSESLSAKVSDSAKVSKKSSNTELNNRFQALLQQIKPKAKTMNLGLPGSSGLVTLIELPEMAENELEQAIRFEAVKHIPSPLDEVAFSWEVVSQKETEGLSEKMKKKTMDILLVAALRKEVTKYEHYVSNVGFPIDLLELEIFSMVRSVVGNAPGATLVVDIGLRATNLILVRDGNIHFNRSFTTGGGEITTSLSKGLGVSLDRAEELKCGDRDFFNKPESSMVFSAFDLITSEMNRIFEIYKEKYPSESIGNIVLSGGTANMNGLQSHFSTMYHVPVSIADPWRGIQSNEMIRPALQKIGSSFAVAIGVALGGIELYRKR